MNNIETRSFKSEFRLNDDENSREIKGLAIPVDSESQLLYGCFYETIERDALSTDFINKQDIKVYLNHDMTQGTYARSKYGNGSLKLEVTDRGLEFSFEAPNTVFGDALLEGIRRGDFDAMSFEFTILEDDWTGDDIPFKRSVKKIGSINEISILAVQPAYLDTEVDARQKITSLREYIEKRQEEKRQAEQEAEDALNNYYEDMLNELEKL